ncbi:MAG TPA: FkbM family methyltransferase [Aggregatilineaceae bacterium]|nr:FkbM family methyltransferase [Aggregatilineaceae bacterium]
MGAHIGYFSVIAGCKVGAEGRVLAFEPMPETFEILTENARLNGFEHVRCIQAAVSDTPTTAIMQTRVDEVGDAFSTLGSLGNSAAVRQVEVQCIKLDDYLGNNSIDRVHLMKVDVEGWETQVFRGATELLSAPDAPALIVEFSDYIAQQAGGSTQALRAQIESFGYELYIYDFTRRELVYDPRSSWSTTISSQSRISSTLAAVFLRVLDKAS